MGQAMTRASADARLISRCRVFMTLAGLDVTASSPNPDLDDPLASAASELFVTTGNSGTVDDADLASLDDRGQAMLLDLAEIRVLEKCLGFLVTMPKRFKFFNEYEEDNSTVVQGFQSYIGAKLASYQARWSSATGIAYGQMEQRFFPAPPCVTDPTVPLPGPWPWWNF